MIPADAIGTTTLALTQSIGSFYTFLPKLSDIRKNHPDSDPEFTADVRIGELAATALSVSVGLIVTSLTGSPYPAIVAGIAAFGLVVMYESVLNAQRPMEVVK